MLRITSIILCVAGLLTAACARTMAGAHVDRGADFAAFQTFAWGPIDTLPTSDMRLTQNIFYRDHVMGAIEKQLKLRGFELVSTATPDLLVHYHANVTERIDVDAADRAAGYCPGGACTSDLVEFERGILVIDVVDARTNRLVWRGWAQEPMTGVFEDATELHRQIDRSVVRLFEQFPTGLRGDTPPTER